MGTPERIFGWHMDVCVGGCVFELGMPSINGFYRWMLVLAS